MKQIATPDASGFLYAFPEDLRAASSSDAGTIIRFRWETESVGGYGSAAFAFRLNCRVSVVDAATKDVLAVRTFHGGNPPTKIYKTPTDLRVRAFEAIVGSAPTEEIRDWLGHLPRQ